MMWLQITSATVVPAVLAVSGTAAAGLLGWGLRTVHGFDRKLDRTLVCLYGDPENKAAAGIVNDLKEHRAQLDDHATRITGIEKTCALTLGLPHRVNVNGETL